MQIVFLDGPNYDETQEIEEGQNIAFTELDEIDFHSAGTPRVTRKFKYRRVSESKAEPVHFTYAGPV